MKKLIGLVLVFLVLYGALMTMLPSASLAQSNFNLARNVGVYGLISLGVGVLIISGGIDLSIGSFIGLCATVLAVGVQRKGWSPGAAIGVVFLLAVAVGLLHGLLVTKAKLQPFVVTLCGLFIYRGLARWYGEDTNAGVGAEELAGFRYVFADFQFLGLPVQFWYLLGAVAVFGVLMHKSVYGRYLFAIGSNDLAAKYSGIHVDRYRILAYVLCSVSAAFFSILYLAEINTAQPASTGAWMELYAIAGAVLGGCSLRGGEGTIAGIVFGTAILFVLKTAVIIAGVPDELEYTAIGVTLLFGAMLDEFLRRRNPAVRKA